MSRNIGRLDRTVRLVLGIVLIALAFVGPRSVWGWIGLLPLLTGAMGYCPLYHLLGLSTHPGTRHGRANTG